MSETNGVVCTASPHDYAETLARLRGGMNRRQLTVYAEIDQRVMVEAALR